MNSEVTWSAVFGDACSGFSLVGEYLDLGETVADKAFCLNFAIAITTSISCGNTQLESSNVKSDAIPWTCTTNYLADSHLVTDSSQNVKTLITDDYQPFGQDNGTPTGSETYKFTGKPASETTRSDSCKLRM